MNTVNVKLEKAKGKIVKAAQLIGDAQRILLSETGVGSQDLHTAEGLLFKVAAEVGE